MSAGQIRVASIPSAHPYVAHLSGPSGEDAVIRLSDPRPLVEHPSPDQWWPPRMLDPGWIQEHRGEFDVVHLHFGFDDATAAQLRDWLAVLRRWDIPLVMTVHDLVNPHFLDPTAHLAQLDILIPGADALITLTPQAAAKIRDRWGLAAEVIRHPHIVPLPRIGRLPTAHEKFVIGVHAKSLRANIDPVPVLAELLPALAGMPDVVLRLDAHPDLVDPANRDPRAAALREWVGEASGHPQVDLQVHPRFDDSQLWDYLQAIDLCILPYRFGTHSGWLEACVDLDTAVLVPATGCYSGQHGHPVYGPGTDGLLDRVRAIVADPGTARPGRPDRWAQRRSIAAAHADVYRRVLRNRPFSRKDSITQIAEVGPA